jgi:hypothetical protein
VYWFSARGTLLYLVKFNTETLPLPESQFGLFPSLDSIAIAPDSHRIFVKIDYYREILYESTNTIAGREPDSSYIWVVNSENADYLKNVQLPFYNSVTVVNNKKVTENLLYSMFGAMNGNRVFLYFPVEEGFSIVILALDDTKEQRRGLINVAPEELQFCTFDVSSDGILSALLAANSEVRMVWWRTDKLAKDM